MKKLNRGIYLLLLKLKEDQRIKPGKLPETDFNAGIYLYVGRARQGLRGRIKRHLRNEKKLFWHIDYLLQKAEIKEIWIKHDFYDECRTVHEIKKILKYSLFPVKNFGSSDCRCRSHLFYLNEDKTDFVSLRNKLSFEKAGINENQV